MLYTLASTSQWTEKIHQNDIWRKLVPKTKLRDLAAAPITLMSADLFLKFSNSD